MKPELESIELVKNETDKQFELTVEGHRAFIQFHEFLIGLRLFIQKFQRKLLEKE